MLWVGTSSSKNVHLSVQCASPPKETSLKKITIFLNEHVFWEDLGRKIWREYWTGERKEEREEDEGREGGEENGKGEERKKIGAVFIELFRQRMGTRKRHAQIWRKRAEVHLHPLDVGFASSAIISWIYLWIGDSFLNKPWCCLCFLFKELSPLSAFTPWEPLNNYSIDNILLTQKQAKKRKAHSEFSECWFQKEFLFGFCSAILQQHPGLLDDG